MPLARQFLNATISETMVNVWKVEVDYSYYGMYSFKETHIVNTLDKAIKWLLLQRCGNDRIRITNSQLLNVSLI